MKTLFTKTTCIFFALAIPIMVLTGCQDDSVEPSAGIIKGEHIKTPPR